ncbi:MAG: hypothetical protein Q7S50_02590 [bacterium]|nr:hypothetical protein [bacterium]
MDRFSYIALCTLGALVLAWAAVGYFAWTIHSDEIARTVYVEDIQQSSMKDASAVRAHALAEETVKERTQLDELLKVDVVSIANMIESVGKAVGVEMKLGAAQPENAPASDTSIRINAVGFVVEAQGKFSALMRAVQLFETLPVPSSVLRIDIERTPSSGSGSALAPWHMNVYIRVLTTADISS